MVLRRASLCGEEEEEGNSSSDQPVAQESQASPLIEEVQPGLAQALRSIHGLTWTSGLQSAWGGGQVRWELGPAFL